MIKDEIAELVKKSLNDTQYNSEVSFELTDDILSRLSEKGFEISLSGYECVIRASEIRHIYKQHPDDVWLITEIPNILKTFKSVKQSNTKDSQTGKPLINLEFYKSYDKKNIKLVKLRIFKNKRLELKTLFVQ